MELPRADVMQALETVLDPELDLDIVSLGLVYGVDLRADGSVGVTLTMTTPACPLSEQIISDVEEALHAHASPSRVEVELVWDPPWTPERMSERAKQELGWKD